MIILQRPLVFFDVESTGLDFIKDQIVCISITAVYPDDSAKKCKLLFKPTIPIPKEATDIHGITDEMVKDNPHFSGHQAKTVYNAMTLGDLGGFNIGGFDVPFMSQRFHEVGLPFPLPDQKIVDVHEIYKKMFPRTLTAAVKDYLGEEMVNAHDAEADNIATLRVFKKQIENHGIDTLDECVAHSTHGVIYVDAMRKLQMLNGVMCYTFGKYKDKPVKSDVGYANWLLKQEWIINQTKNIIQKEIQ